MGRAQKLNRVLIVDVESSCWETKPPDGHCNDIIEIGVVVVNTISLERPSPAAGERMLVAPTSSEISDYCTRLTGIDKTMADKGHSFSEACTWLRDIWHSRSQVWASWGNYDRVQFASQCKREGIEYPFSKDHINLKTLFGLMLGLPRGVGVHEALGMIGKEFVGRQHSALDDALNIAELFLWMMNVSQAGQTATAGLKENHRSTTGLDSIVTELRKAAIANGRAQERNAILRYLIDHHAFDLATKIGEGKHLTDTATYPE